MLMFTQAEMAKALEKAKAEARQEIADHLRYHGEHVLKDWNGRDLFHAAAADIEAGKFAGPVPVAPF